MRKLLRAGRFSGESRGPDYVSHGEWKSRRERSRRVWLRLVLAILVLCGVCLVGAVAYFSVRLFLFDRLRGDLLDKLSALSNYQVDVYRASESGGMSLWRTEIHRGDDWEVQLFGGQLTFVKVDRTYYCHTRNPDSTATSSSWSGLQDFVPHLVAQVESLKLGFLSDTSSQLRREQDPGQKLSYRCRIGDEDFFLTFDDSGKVPLELTVSAPTLEGYGVVERAEFSYRANSINRTFPEGARDSTAPKAKAGPCTLQNPLLLRADANTFGDCLFDFRGLPLALSAGTVLRFGNRIYKVYSAQTGSDTWQVSCVAAQGGITWPLKLHVSLPVLVHGSRKWDSFPCEFKGPTCWLLPNRKNEFDSDYDYLDYLYLRTSARHIFMESSNDSPKLAGQTDPHARSRKQRMAEEVSDDLTLLWLARESEDDSTVGLDERMQTWIDLGLVLSAAGDPRARNAFVAAQSMVAHYPELRPFQSAVAANAARAHAHL